MGTRQLVIETTIALFNERGVASVRVRDIASALSISVGNLTYHFANKDALVRSVLETLIHEMETTAGAALQDEPSFSSYRRLLQQVWALQQTYRFFYLDAVEILRTYPNVRALYRTALLRRLEQSETLVARLVERGLVRPLRDAERTELVKRSWMVVAAWPYRLFVLDENPSRAVFVREVLDVLAPYATPSGVSALCTLPGSRR